MAHKPTTDDHLFDCSECGKSFEVLTEDAVVANCPWCGAQVILLRGGGRSDMKVCVVMLDTHRTRMAVIHENEHVPYRRRLVEVYLTPEQEEQLEGRKVGVEDGEPVFEEIGPMWIEP